MSTYDDSLLGTRFALLAPEPLAGSWEDVLGGQAPLGSPEGAGSSSRLPWLPWLPPSQPPRSAVCATSSSALASSACLQ